MTGDSLGGGLGGVGVGLQGVVRKDRTGVKRRKGRREGCHLFFDSVFLFGKMREIRTQGRCKKERTCGIGRKYRTRRGEVEREGLGGIGRTSELHCYVSKLPHSSRKCGRHIRSRM